MTDTIHAANGPMNIGRLRAPALITALVGIALVPSALLAADPMRSTDVVALAQRFSRYADDLPPVASLGVDRILAYEEHAHFVYVRGALSNGDRRIVFCKPATFIVLDTTQSRDASWKLACEEAPAINATGFTVGAGDTSIDAHALLPGKGFTVQRAGDAHVATAGFRIRPKGGARFLVALGVGGKGGTVAAIDKNGVLTVKVTSGARTFEITLPPHGSGTIAVSKGGDEVLAKRVLAAGILPHGQEGVRQLDRWDSAYRRSGAPGWDVGRPASELTSLVESKTVRTGRALVIGCGTGTNAVYLASQGFEVTAIDIAPTALALGERRARAAKVEVRWLLADAVALPPVGPFDLIFDRGCYHHVRGYDAKGFVAGVNRLSRPGTHFLILAGNANEPRHYGPPRVDETELVNDYAATWDFVWLREMRFESRDPNRKNGPWAWSALVRRKGEAK